MEEGKQPYNKFIRKPSNSNVLLNVSLIAAFILLVVSQFLLSRVMTQQHLRTSTTLSSDATTSEDSDIALVSSDLKLTSCSDDDLGNAVAIARSAIVNIDVVSSDVGLPMIQRPGPLNFDIPSSQSLKTNEETLGSGIIVDHRGYVLTCYHLVQLYKKVYVTVFQSQRRTYPAELVGADESQDLALLKINPDTPLPTAKLGNSDLAKVTDTVLTIGSPFGFEHTVTAGILSDNKRNIVINGRMYQDLFLTDAAINRGSAGGALINGSGEVIGVNTAIVSPTGLFAGIGISIPVNRARSLMFKSIEP